MAYRSGTYVAFYAAGSSDPTESDMKYYRMLTAWHANDGIQFRLINSHEKAAAVRDSSSKLRLRDVLAERLRNSRNMVLINTPTTKLDTDWVPFEIAYAVDKCEIPIIVAYPGMDFIVAPHLMADWWPAALATRIRSGAAHAIHVPFKQTLLNDAIKQFGPDNYPVGGSMTVYSRSAYASVGIYLPS
jgi:hypothetical protein